MYTKSVQPAQLQSSRAQTLDLSVTKAPEGPTKDVQIQRISEPSHPAHGQSGLFAARDLKPNTFICFYLGLVHGAGDTDPASNYDLSLDPELHIGVDATKMGNEARFVNDYRGIRTAGPNAEFRDCLLDLGSGLLEKSIGVFVLTAGKKGGKQTKGIGKGEEILVSYGKGFWSHRRVEEKSIE